tara:strand:+ start:27887 stop:29125 length:1239 start_codon:yes stop_codon:yes gene_type:complete
MKKIGIIVQRYGLEVNGGAEYHAKVLADKLSKNHSIDIITTCALDSNSWDNHYKISDNLINGINILRFPSEIKNQKTFRKARRKILGSTKPQQFLKKTGLLNVINKTTNLFTLEEKDSENWLKEQGPNCPELVNYIEEEQEKYDCFIFFTYLYYPTARGMKNVGHKSIFIPTAHDEELLYSGAYNNLFSIPKYIIYNTKSEQKLVETSFPNCTKNSAIAGVGIDKTTVPSKHDSKLHYDSDYLLYIGRVDGGKGCLELIEYFNNADEFSSLKLVFVGKKSIEFTQTEDIIFTGFVDETTKQHLLNNCKALIIPSKYESLSLVTLEAMMQKKIVIANGQCEVLQNHILDSEAGFSYTDQKSYKKTINSLLNLSQNEEESMGENGHKYVVKNYAWDRILDKFDKAFEFVIESNK